MFSLNMEPLRRKSLQWDLAPHSPDRTQSTSRPKKFNKIRAEKFNEKFIEAEKVFEFTSEQIIPPGLFTETKLESEFMPNIRSVRLVPRRHASDEAAARNAPVFSAQFEARYGPEEAAEARERKLALFKFQNDVMDQPRKVWGKSRAVDTYDHTPEIDFHYPDNIFSWGDIDQDRQDNQDSDGVTLPTITSRPGGYAPVLREAWGV